MTPTPEQIAAWAREAGVFSGANERVFLPSLQRFAALVDAHRAEQDALIAKTTPIQTHMTAGFVRQVQVARETIEAAILASVKGNTCQN